MQCQRATTTVRRTDFLPPALQRLCTKAAAVINEHVNDADLCAICGSAWPCERVQLAEHNLDLL